METVFEFNDLDELKSHLDKEVLFYVVPAYVSPHDFEYYTVYQCYDSRIGWDSYLLMGRYHSPLAGIPDEFPFIFGYVNAPIIGGVFCAKNISPKPKLIEIEMGFSPPIE